LPEIDVEYVVRVAKQLGFTVDPEKVRKNQEELEKWRAETRETRRRHVDWEYIERQPEPLKSALKLLVETGDLKLAAQVAGQKLGDLNEHRIKAKIPITL